MKDPSTMQQDNLLSTRYKIWTELRYDDDNVI